MPNKFILQKLLSQNNNAQLTHILIGIRHEQFTILFFNVLIWSYSQHSTSTGTKTSEQHWIINDNYTTTQNVKVHHQRDPTRAWNKFQALIRRHLQRKATDELIPLTMKSAIVHGYPLCAPSWPDACCRGLNWIHFNTLHLIDTVKPSDIVPVHTRSG